MQVVADTAAVAVDTVAVAVAVDTVAVAAEEHVGEVAQRKVRTHSSPPTDPWDSSWYWREATRIQPAAAEVPHSSSAE